MGLKILYNNINGYSSKRESLNKIVKDIQPDIVALCETKKCGKINKDDLYGYQILESDLKRGKEGILIAVKDNIFKSIRDVSDVNNELKNIMVTKIEFPSVVLRVIIAHSPQEDDKQDMREEFTEELSVQIERGMSSGEKVIVLGDFNGRLASDGQTITGGSSSPNGKALCEVVENYQLKVGNFSEVTTGKWTRIQARKDGSVAKSVLDYVLMGKNLFDNMKDMYIDEEKIYCPYREINRKGKKHIIYSDHCPIILNFDLELGEVLRDNIKKKVWDFSEEGFAKYGEESQKEITVSQNHSMTTVYGEWVDNFEALLGRSFYKKTIKFSRTDDGKLNQKNLKGIRSLLLPIAKRGKIQRGVVQEYVNKLVEKETILEANLRAKRLHEAMLQLSEEEKFSPMGYWKLKQAAKKKKRGELNMLSVIKENGVEVERAGAVKEAYKEEFEKRLENRKPYPDWVRYTEETNEVVRRWLSSKSSEESDPFLPSEMNCVIKSLKNNSPGLDGYPPSLFKRAGVGVRKSLLEVINMIKASKDIPEQWDLVKIVAIYKQKGSKKMLKYYRGIFLTIVISKIFEKLIKNRIEDQLNNVNILQAGSRKNRGGPDNVFLLRGCIDHHLFTKQSLFVTAYDFEQAFDSLWLEDCVLSLKKIGVGKDMLQLIYNLNKNAKVTVQTPHGMTTTFTTDPIVKQGTVLGPILCSTSTGEHCEESTGVAVGTLLLASLLYVDDIIDVTNTINDRKLAHEIAMVFGRKKKIFYSGTKCYSMAINYDADNVPILKINEESNVVDTDEIVYLGDVFNEKGNNDGLISDRVKRGTKAMIAISSLIAENEVGSHKISVLLLLYQALFLSTMLFNSQTWSKLRNEDIEKLQVIQLKCLKRVIGVSTSAPNSQIFLELGVLPIEAEIHKRQMGFLHRILNLGQNDPVYQMFCNMVTFSDAGEKNWWTQVQGILDKYGISKNLVSLKLLSKEEFKKMVREAITKKVVEELIKEYHSLKKCQKIEYSSLQMQDYLQVLYPDQARTIFMIRSHMLDIKTHRTHKYHDTICRGCGVENETVDHIVNCGLPPNDHIKVDLLGTEKLTDLSKYQMINTINRIDSFLGRV